MARSERFHSGTWIALAAAAACALAAGSCRVDIPADAKFPCRTDAECGDGAKCMPRPGTVIGVCCVLSPETCDGQDNDCNGVVDDNVPPRTCYDGPPEKAGVGICKSGESSCIVGGSGQFG